MRTALDRERVGVVVPRLLNADLTVQPSVLPFIILRRARRASG